MKPVPRNEGFSQVCVWPGTTGCMEDPEGFTSYFKDELKTRVQLLEEIQTYPDQGERDSGGRTDVFFAVHKDDVMKFALPRLQMGIRWIEDVLDNQEHHTPGYSIYPDHVKEYRTW
jgi:hypothetical protein